MADKDNANQDSLEPTPVFDSAGTSNQSSSNQTEETPEDLTISDIGGVDETAAGLPPIDEAAFNDDSGGNKKKIVFIIVGVVIFISIFALLVSFLLRLRGGSSSDEKITLVYWGLWEDPEVMKVVIDEYKQIAPNVTIEYEKQDKRNYREKLIARGNEGRGPDIFRYHNTWLPSITEVVAPLPSDVMSNEEFEETFYEVTQRDLKIEDSYHGLPLMIDGLVLIYNKELFSNIGVSAAPKTWEDVVDIAKDLQVKDAQENVLTSGISLGTANNIEHFSDIFGWMLLQNGADLTTLRSPEAVGALENYRSFSEPPFSFWTKDMPNNVGAFIQGQVGMIIAPSWQILEIKNANEDLDIGVAPLPILPGGEQLSIATYWVEGVSKTSTHQEEAWAFLKYLTEEETMTTLYSKQAETRLFGDPYSRVDLKDKLIQNEYIGPVLSQAPYMQSLPMASRTFDAGLNDEIITYIENAINSAGNGVAYDQAMLTAAQGIEKVLEKYNIE